MNDIWNQLLTFFRLAAEKPWMREIFKAVKESFFEAVIKVLQKELDGRRSGGLTAA